MERLTPEDYLREALTVLAEQGPDALTIAAVCERLDVTKGSFYHHFGGLPGFVEQLLAHWEREQGRRLSAISKRERDPARRLAALPEFAVDLAHESESAFRAWGRSNPDVAEAVARVDKRRERFFADAIAAHGVERPRARLLARIALDLLIGIQQRDLPPEPRRVRQMFEELARLADLDG